MNYPILPDKVYNALKWILGCVYPALMAFISGAGLLYGFDTKLIVGTISLIAVFLGAIFGISVGTYKASKKQSTDKQKE